MTAFYKASSISRKRRTDAEICILEAQIYRALEQDHLQSVRHVFYRMTDPRLIVPVHKSQKGYAQVQDRILKMRRSGALAYGFIVDLSRNGYVVETYDSPADFLKQRARLYRSNLWAQVGNYCEVWVESRPIASAVRHERNGLAVNLIPTSGFPSASLAYEAARHINNSFAHRPVTVLYVGDYDPAGILIDKSAERELRKHLRQDVQLDFRRIAITAEQIVRYDLPTKPRNQPGALEIAKITERSERGYLTNLADAVREAHR
jgi:hypothetical protein